MIIVALFVNIFLLFQLAFTAGQLSKMQPDRKRLVTSMYRWLWSPFIMFGLTVALYALINFILGQNSSESADSRALTENIAAIANMILFLLGGFSIWVLPLLSWVAYYNKNKQLAKMPKNRISDSSTGLMDKKNTATESSPHNDEDLAKMSVIRLGFREVNKINISDDDIQKLPQDAQMKYYKKGLKKLSESLDE